MGALGIMAPNVKNSAEARALQRLLAPPLGKRGVMVGAASTDFLSVDARQYMGVSNETTTLICQIESREGLENIAEIAQTAGIDVLWVGHFDLSTSLGIPAQFHHDKFLDALRRNRAANQYGLLPQFSQETWNRPEWPNWF
jgi:2-dehydro-3-deoxyglucarate aldolase/4-hydroxy-2-oxoheptanedioate aldolase